MFEDLKFRRQFLVSTMPLTQLACWKCLSLTEYYLYVHPDLETNQVTNQTRNIVLIGNIFDYKNPEKRNPDILNDILLHSSNLDEFFSFIRHYAGCYALLLKDDSKAVILHDARGLREIYYYTGNSQVVCGSQPHLLAKFAGPRIKPTEDPDLLDFCRNHLWDSRWVGDETYFEGVRHLLPNHYLDIKKREVRRYWPNRPIEKLGLHEAVWRGSSFLQGITRAMVLRHPVMMAVTAGTDSRTLLAATRDIREKVYYFVNDNDLGYKHPDISIPSSIFDRVGLPFHVHTVSKDVDDQFRLVFLNNTFLATERMLPSIYNIFFKHHSEKIYALGVSEIARTFYGRQPRRLHAFRMAYKLGYKDCRYVIRQCEKIRVDIIEVAKRAGMNVMALLYWEQRLGNWGAARNSESLIAIEKIDPYNSHLLYETFLGVDEKYRSYLQTPCLLFKEMIHHMWPELLAWPINPAYTLQDRIFWFLQKSGTFEPLKELKYLTGYARRALRARPK